MSDTKLEKVSKRLYHEPYKDGKPFNWAKRLRFLFLTLTDVRVDLCLSIERPETSFSQLQKNTEKEIEDDEKAEQDDTTASGEEKEDEKYSEDFAWRIIGTGRLDDTIGLIRKDGTPTDYMDHFDRADVVLRPVSGTDKQKAVGFLWYSDAKWEKRPEPYLRLELFVPELQFEKLCHEIVSGRLSTLQVGAYIDVFQSEVDSALSEPPMRQRFYIEEDGSFNSAYLSWLTASQSIANQANDRGPSFNDVFSAQTGTLRLISQQLASIRIVGILVLIAVLLMLWLK